MFFCTITKKVGGNSSWVLVNEPVEVIFFLLRVCKSLNKRTPIGDCNYGLLNFVVTPRENLISENYGPLFKQGTVLRRLSPRWSRTLGRQSVKGPSSEILTPKILINNYMKGVIREPDILFSIVFLTMVYLRRYWLLVLLFDFHYNVGPHSTVCSNVEHARFLMSPPSEVVKKLFK